MMAIQQINKNKCLVMRHQDNSSDKKYNEKLVKFKHENAVYVYASSFPVQDPDHDIRCIGVNYATIYKFSNGQNSEMPTIKLEIIT